VLTDLVFLGSIKSGSESGAQVVSLSQFSQVGVNPSTADRLAGRFDLYFPAVVTRGFSFLSARYTLDVVPFTVGGDFNGDGLFDKTVVPSSSEYGGRGYVELSGSDPLSVVTLVAGDLVRIVNNTRFAERIGVYEVWDVVLATEAHGPRIVMTGLIHDVGVVEYPTIAKVTLALGGQVRILEGGIRLKRRCVEDAETVLPADVLVYADGATGAPVTASVADVNGLKDGVTTLARKYLPGTVVTLTAAATVGEEPDVVTFASWKRNGVDQGSANPISETVSVDVAFTAVYA
jgi:hypothetical protein